MPLDPAWPWELLQQVGLRARSPLLTAKGVGQWGRWRLERRGLSPGLWEGAHILVVKTNALQERVF